MVKMYVVMMKSNRIFSTHLIQERDNYLHFCILQTGQQNEFSVYELVIWNLKTGGYRLLSTLRLAAK